MSTLEKALRAGCKLKVFLSGGGLRVARLEAGEDNLFGYGEHPHLEEALAHVAEDYAAGGRPYEEVYGESGIHTHYLTGARETSSPLDEWVRRGNKISAVYDDGDFVVTLSGYGQHELPEGVMDRVIATGQSERHEQRGYTYEVVRSRFPTGAPCVTCNVVGTPLVQRLGSDPWMWQEKRIGRGASFEAACEAALAATPMEA